MDLVVKLEKDPKIGIHLGNNYYKIRVKNTDIKKGKSAGYRVIYYLIDENYEVWILKIYSKSEIDNLSNEYIFSLLKEG